MIITIAISGYRTLREVILPLGRLNIVTGPNGSGKSSLYRSIRLLADAAQGRIISSLASEGGLQSTLWAGPEAFSRRMASGEVPIQGTVRRDVVSLKLGFASDDYGYAIDLGLPAPIPPSAFNGDPQIKTEAVWVGEYLKRSNLLADRNGPRVSVLEDRQRSISLDQLAPYDSMMTHAAHPRATPELLLLRERMRDWRFYDHFRTDRDAPARRPQIGTRTTALSADGADLAAAFQTIDEIGASQAMHDAIADAFPGTAIEIETNSGMFEILLRQHGLLRPLRAAELSDGTLRFCC
jgi:predicted ATPase